MLIDDAQWIDRESIDALLFAARRIEAECVAFVFAASDGGDALEGSGLRELCLRPLDDAAAAELLADQAADLAPQVRDRIIRDACGNPLALIELPAALTAEQRAGGLSSAWPGIGGAPTSGWVRRNFGDQIRALPERSQILLLVAAAADTGDAALILEAARDLGVSLADLEPVEGRRLMRFAGGRLLFRHPLIRTSAYEDAPLTRRLAVHRALAGVLEGEEHVARRAWHLAAAADGPDENIAAELERGAEQARERCGHATVAAAYERAAQLSPDPSRRGHRLSVAAHAAGEAGQPRRAAMLADQAAAHITDPLVLADLARCRAALAFEQGHPEAAHAMLIEAAAPIACRAPEKAAFIMFEAMSAAWSANDEDLVSVTAERLSAMNLPETRQVRPLVRGAEGIAHIFMRRPGIGIPALREMTAELRNHGRSLVLWERAGIGAWDHLMGDLQASHDGALAIERECRDRGAIGVLPRTLLRLAYSQLFVGLPDDACASATEGVRIAQETHQPQYVSLLKAFLATLAAMEGDEERCRELTGEVTANGTSLGAARCASAIGQLDLRWAGTTPRCACWGPRRLPCGTPSRSTASRIWSRRRSALGSPSGRVRRCRGSRRGPRPPPSRGPPRSRCAAAPCWHRTVRPSRNYAEAVRLHLKAAIRSSAPGRSSSSGKAAP